MSYVGHLLRLYAQQDYQLTLRLFPGPRPVVVWRYLDFAECE